MAVVSSCSVCLGAVTLHSAHSSPGCVWLEDWQCVTHWHVPAACLLDNKMCLKEWGNQGRDSWHSISVNSLSWIGEQALFAATGAKIPDAQGFVDFFVGVLGFTFSLPLCPFPRAAAPRDLQGLSIPAFQHTKKSQINPWVKTDPCCLPPYLHMLIKQMLNWG